MVRITLEVTKIMIGWEAKKWFTPDVKSRSDRPQNVPNISEKINKYINK